MKPTPDDLVAVAFHLTKENEALKAQVARLESEVRGAVVVASVLIKRLGGEVTIPESEIVNFDMRQKLLFWDDPELGKRLRVVRE